MPATYEMGWSIVGQETDKWTTEWDTSINPKKPEYFNFQQTDSGLLVVCGGAAYEGALLKNSAPFKYQTPSITARYRFRFGLDLLACGQVIELDRKFTDDAGWTYDGSFQINFAQGMMCQYGAPWKNTGVNLGLNPSTSVDLETEYKLDYTAHTLALIRVNQNQIPSAVMPAKQIKWTPSSIITQVQLCTNSKGGFYSVNFESIQISGQQ